MRGKCVHKSHHLLCVSYSGSIRSGRPRTRSPPCRLPVTSLSHPWHPWPSKLNTSLSSSALGTRQFNNRLTSRVEIESGVHFEQTSPIFLLFPLCKITLSPHLHTRDSMAWYFLGICSYGSTAAPESLRPAQQHGLPFAPFFWFSLTRSLPCSFIQSPDVYLFCSGLNTVLGAGIRWLEWWSAYLESLRPWVRAPVLPKGFI